MTHKLLNRIVGRWKWTVLIRLFAGIGNAPLNGGVSRCRTRRGFWRNRLVICPAFESLEPRMMLTGTGTEFSVIPVSDINPMIGDGHGATSSLTSLDGRLYFPGRGENGVELYAYDPQTDSTFEVADINPDGDSNPGAFSDFFVFDDRLFFDATGPDGNELQAYDPQTGIVSQIGDINPDGDSFPSFGDVIDGRLLFRATGPNGTELYEYDPDAVGNPLREFNINESGSSFPAYFTVFDDRLFFHANGPFGEELYVYDPETRDVELVADINPSTTVSSSAQFFQPFDGLLFFNATEGNGFREVFAFNPETDELIDFDVTMTGIGFTPFGDRLYFTRYSGVFAYDANTDSIELTTSNLYVGGFGIAQSTAIYQDRLYFSVQGNAEYPSGVYSYDSDGLLDRLVDPLLDGIRSASDFQVFDDRLFFTATDANFEEELYTYDGNTGQVTKFDLNLVGGSRPFPLPDFENLLLFRAAGPNGIEIFAYDPATKEVTEVADVNPDGDANPWLFTRFDNRMFFIADTAEGYRIFALERQLPPVATNDDAITGEDIGVEIDVLANDTDPNNDSVSIIAVTQPANGSVAISTDGTLVYTPDADFSGSDSFLYTIDDGHCGTSTATVNVTVVASELQIPILVDEVELLGNAGALNRGQVNSLTSKLEQALERLDADDLRGSILKLRAFAHQVNAYRNAGILSEQQADSLLEQVAELIVGIGLGADGIVGNALEMAARDNVFADVDLMQEILNGP